MTRRGTPDEPQYVRCPGCGEHVRVIPKRRVACSLPVFAIENHEHETSVLTDEEAGTMVTLHQRCPWSKARVAVEWTETR